MVKDYTPDPTNPEDMGTLAQQIDDQLNQGKWDIGDLTLQLSNQDIDEFARTAQISTSVARKYNRMSKFYEPETRSICKVELEAGYDIMFQALIYHNAKNKPPASPQTAIEFLEHCSKMNALTHEAVIREKQILQGKPPKPKRVYRGEATIKYINVENGEAVINLDRDNTDILDIEKGQYVVTLNKVIEQESKR
jgi:hypothetical protein